ncbi:MAG: Mitochondrial fission protein [Caeruleum heppii]|nr:MAG: Mitochondrial fission protein [Caeruleum heppii]
MDSSRTPQDSTSAPSAEDSGFANALTTRNIEAFGRKVTTTAGHLLGPLADPAGNTTYHNAMTELHKELRRPNLQRRVFSFAQASPTEIVRAKLSTSEIQNRALTYLPDELLANIPEDDNTFSLFQGFQATLPETDGPHHRGHRKRGSRGPKQLTQPGSDDESHTPLDRLKKERHTASHQLELLGIRKNLASSEIREIDNRISNLNSMRRIVLDRLADLEQEEVVLEHDIQDFDIRIDDLQEELDDAALLPESVPANPDDDDSTTEKTDSHAMDASFMSESIYQKIPSPKSKRRKPPPRRKSMPILHEHFEPGSSIKEIPAHNDTITALDFDYPFGTMVTAALDDTVRVWDLNAGRCMGMLEGHHASVRCLQVEENLVATGSMDASIRLWDLSRVEYQPPDNRINKEVTDEDDGGLAYENPDDLPPPPPASSLRDCPLFSLEAHVDEVTALHFKGDTLVSGSADKTLRQWDLQKGRCVQTLDVLWAAAQASATQNSNDGQWRTTGRLPDASADFVGALQCFDAALACGTADGMVRLWDLRSGQVHRSLVGHTGPVTCLQFDDVHLVTGSLDRSIRIWDLRTGSIHDAYAYDHPITSMQFDTRRIVSAAGEDMAKIYDKTDGRHWDCGAGAAAAEEESQSPAVVERVRVKDGYLVEGPTNKRSLPGDGRPMPVPKRNLQATAAATTDPPATLLPHQFIGRVVRAVGKNIFSVELPTSEQILVELPRQFRSTIWMKRGGFVVVDRNALGERDNKLGGEIVVVVREEREWRKMAYWPEHFAKVLVSHDADSDEEESIVGKMPPSRSDSEGDS